MLRHYDGNVGPPDIKNWRLSGCGGEFIPDQKLVKITLNTIYLC